MRGVLISLGDRPRPVDAWDRSLGGDRAAGDLPVSGRDLRCSKIFFEKVAMEQRALGDQGLAVSALGLGCMGMSESYGTGDEDESISTIHRAIELGVTFLDTADVYGPFTNERLVGKAIRGRRDEVTLAT